MKQLLMLAIALGLILSLNANPLWDTPKTVRQNDQVEWNRCGAATADGSMIYVWTGTKRGDRDIYAQKVNASGAMLWQQPLLVDGKPARQSNPVISRTSDNNFIIAWWDYPITGAVTIRAQKITSNGQLLWSAGGIPVCSVAQNFGSMEILADNNNGAYVVWMDTRNPSYDVYGQHLDGFGNSLWLTDGMPLANDNAADEQYYAISVDTSGSLILSYQICNYSNISYPIMAQRFLSSGNAAWSQPLLVGNAYRMDPDLQMAANSDGSFVVTWSGFPNSTYQNPNIYAQKVNLTGSLGWTNPVAVYADTNIEMPTEQFNPRIVNSVDNAVIIAWEDRRNDIEDSDLFIQKVSAEGAILWNADGVPVCTEDYAQTNQRLVSDNMGGCYLAWEDYRNNNSSDKDIYAQHISINGTALWEAQGKVICNAAITQTYPMIRYINNNVFVGWVDARSGSPCMYYQVVNSAGNAVLETNGKQIYQAIGNGIDYSSYLTLPRSNDAVIIWKDYRGSLSGYRLYFQFQNTDGSFDLETNGRLVALNANVSYDQNCFSATVTPDNKIAVVWEENYRIKAQLLDANGNRLWGENGIELSEDTALIQRVPKISFEDGAYYLGWNQIETVQTPDGMRQLFHAYGQKLVNGQKQWGANGILISGYTPETVYFEAQMEQIVGRYYIWTRTSLDPATWGILNVWVKLVNPDGTTASGWADAGIPVSDYGDYDTVQYMPQCVMTNAGLFVAWLDFRADFIKSVYGQMISPQGVLLWNPSGLALTDNAYENGNFAILGGSSDVTLFYVAMPNGYVGSVMMQKFSLSGTPLLSLYGSYVSSGEQYAYTRAIYPVQFPNGGMLVAWEQNINNYDNSIYTSPDIYYRYINADGSLLGANTGICLSAEVDNQLQPRLVVTGNEAFLFWADSDYYSTNDLERCDEGPAEYYSLYAQKLSNEVVAVEDETNSPSLIRLAQNSPNPFVASTNISFTLKSGAAATLTIYNQKGQKVKTLHNGLLEKGKHSFSWNGLDDNNKKVSSGIYMYRLSDGSTNQTKKMVMLK
jgi:hypothetical protein